MIKHLLCSVFTALLVSYYPLELNMLFMARNASSAVGRASLHASHARVAEVEHYVHVVYVCRLNMRLV